jgi:hypothetical protein
MPTKHVVADLFRFKTSLKVEVDVAEVRGGSVRFDVVKLCRTSELRELVDRFKCSLCGAREAKLTVLSPPAPRN